MKTSSKRKTHFVPAVVYRTAFAGVVPVCVAAAACSSGGSSGADAGMNYSVACSGFCGVAMQGFVDAGDAAEAMGDALGDAPNANPDGSCFCCTNFCGVGVMAFADVGTGG